MTKTFESDDAQAPMASPAEGMSLQEGTASRRAFAGLLGAFGALVLKGCGEDFASSAGDVGGPDGEGGDLSALQLALNGTTNIRWFDTVATMRAFSIGGNTNYTAIVHGYYAVGDGGGGVFAWSTAPALDDGKLDTALYSGAVVNPLVAGKINSSPAAGWRRIYAGTMNVRWFGAKGDRSVDDAPAIATAIRAASATGCRVLIPAGQYLVGPNAESGHADVLLPVEADIEIEGVGRGTRLMVHGSTATSVDVFRIKPTTGSNGGRLIRISGLCIEPDTGTAPSDAGTPPAPGRHGVAIDVSAPGRVVSMLELYRLYIGALGGRGIASITQADGFFDSSIRQCEIANGILFDQCGDNIYIENCLISGLNYGVEITQTTLSQALVIRQNAMTGGGGIWIKRAEAPVIADNQVEPSVSIQPIAGRKPLIVIEGGPGAEAVRDARIERNWLNMTADADTALYIDSALNATVERNRFNPPPGGRLVHITANALNTYIGPSNGGGTYDVMAYDSVTDTMVHISDNGVGTSGVRRPLAALLSNGWLKYSTDGAPMMIKGEDRFVRLAGYLKNGTHTAGTTILTLPPGYRPSTQLLVRVPCITSIAGNVEMILEISRYAGTINVYVDPDPGATIWELHLTGIAFPVLQVTYL